MLGTLPSKVSFHLMSSGHFAGKCCTYSTFCTCVCSVEFQKCLLSFLFLGNERETGNGQGIFSRLEFSKATRD